MSLIGMHIGATGCKVIVFREDGPILGHSSRAYSIMTPQPGWAEQEAERVWQMAWESLEDALAMAGRNDLPKAMAIATQDGAVIPLDRSGYTLRYAIHGSDERAAAESEWLAEQFGAETLNERTGFPIRARSMPSKLLWLKKNEPDIWNNSGQFATYEDFFLRRFSTVASISHCLASRTQIYDLAQGDWADDILDQCEVQRAQLAPLAPREGGVVGSLRVQMSHELGIHREMPIVSGGYERACAALGAGAIQPGAAILFANAPEIVTAVLDSTSLDEWLRRGVSAVYKHVVPGLYLAEILPSDAGLCNVPIRVSDAANAACRGAALLAGRGVGVYASLEDAVKQIVKGAQ